HGGVGGHGGGDGGSGVEVAAVVLVVSCERWWRCRGWQRGGVVR
nr:hypothetical protein [Tanacetum cinerariifolium]